MAAQLLHHFSTSEQIIPSLLNHFTPLGTPTLTSFYPLWTNYPLTNTAFYPLAGQLLHHFTPSEKITFYTILPPLAAQLLHHFIPSEQVTPHLYTILPFGSPTLTSFYTLWTNYHLTLKPIYPPWQPNSYIILQPLKKKLSPHFYTILTPLAAQLLHHFTPLGSPTPTSIYPLWTNYHLTLKPFYPPWHPNSYIILAPLNKLPPHS